jgi:hypothetical protein
VRIKFNENFPTTFLATTQRGVRCRHEEEGLTGLDLPSVLQAAMAGDRSEEGMSRVEIRRLGTVDSTVHVRAEDVAVAPHADSDAAAA